jgi:two-component system cell cycle response regulator DivK
MQRVLPVSDRPRRRDPGSGPRRSWETGVRARPRVLIVDDDVDTRELYAWCMRAAGWFVQVASNGAEALLGASLYEPDVIVMDLHMPLLGGLDAVRLLRRDKATKHVPIVACTALDRPTIEVEARDAGCDEFVPKPCEPEVLRDLVEAMVSGRAT